MKFPKIILFQGMYSKFFGDYMYANRTIQSHIEKYMFKNKAIILNGPRQVGKTKCPYQQL